jgi:hypothetical protein
VLLGALVAFTFLPSRREFGAAHAGPAEPGPAAGVPDTAMAQ